MELPIEIIDHIISFCDLETKKTLRLVSIEIYMIVAKHNFWEEATQHKYLFKRMYPTLYAWLLSYHGQRRDAGETLLILLMRN